MAAPDSQRQGDSGTTTWKGYRIAGVLLVCASLLGFATVADDLRHVGELFAVGSMLAAGLSLMAAGYENPLSQRFAFQWLAVGLAMGVAIGAPFDNLPAGAGLGAAIGCALAHLRAKRP